MSLKALLLTVSSFLIHSYIEKSALFRFSRKDILLLDASKLDRHLLPFFYVFWWRMNRKAQSTLPWGSTFVQKSESSAINTKIYFYCHRFKRIKPINISSRIEAYSYHLARCTYINLHVCRFEYLEIHNWVDIEGRDFKFNCSSPQRSSLGQA